MSTNNGKGSQRRPFDREKWDEGYERIFGKGKLQGVKKVVLPEKKEAVKEDKNER